MQAPDCTSTRRPSPTAPCSKAQQGRFCQQVAFAHPPCLVRQGPLSMRIAISVLSDVEHMDSHMGTSWQCYQPSHGHRTQRSCSVVRSRQISKRHPGHHPASEGIRFDRKVILAFWLNPLERQNYFPFKPSFIKLGSFVFGHFRGFTGDPEA